MTKTPRQGPLPAAERPKNYPAIGDKLLHGMSDETGTVVAIAPHPEAHKTRQRAITVRTGHGHDRTFEMSVKNFWFNWRPAR